MFPENMEGGEQKWSCGKEGRSVLGSNRIHQLYCWSVLSIFLTVPFGWEHSGASRVCSCVYLCSLPNILLLLFLVVVVVVGRLALDEDEVGKVC